MRMKKRMLAGVLALSFLFAALAGCGAKEGQGPASPAPGAETKAPGSEKDTSTIKIGLSAPITGNNAEYGVTFQTGCEIAIDEVNEAGGINGRKVELVVMDSKGDAKEACEIAKKFGQDSEILGVVGEFSSTACMAAAPIYADYKLCLISPTASAPEFAPMNEYMFGIAGLQSDEGPFMAKYIGGKYLNSQATAVAYVNNDWGVSTKDGVISAAAEIGTPIVANETFVENEKDFNALLTKLRQANPDVIQLAAFPTDASNIIKQARQMGWDVPFVLPCGGYSDQLIELGGEAVDGTFVAVSFFPDADNTVVQEYITEFQKRAGFNGPISMLHSYDCARIIMQAIERATAEGKGSDREAIRDQIAATKDFPALGGTITFSESGDVHKKYRIATVQDGQFTSVTDYDFMD